MSGSSCTPSSLQWQVPCDLLATSVTPLTSLSRRRDTPELRASRGWPPCPQPERNRWLRKPEERPADRAAWSRSLWLDGEPLDRALLEAFTELASAGTIADVPAKLDPISPSRATLCAMSKLRDTRSCPP
jgi:hypothetical protein